MASHLKKKDTTRRSSRLRRIVKGKTLTAALSLALALVMTMSLVLPAIAVNDRACVLDEHTHSEEAGCYTTVPVTTLSCPYGDLEAEGHVAGCARGDDCTCPQILVHIHDERCLDETGALSCPLPEIREHTHDESCYAPVEPETEEIENETPAHTHIDACWEWLVGIEPLCGLEETAGHTHDDGCLDEEGSLVCTLEEFPGHTHTNDCCGLIKGALLCKLEETLPETETEPEPETDTETEPEPEPEPEPELSCDKDELVLHQHNDDCWELVEIARDEVQESDTVVEDDEDADTVSILVLSCDLPVALRHQHTDACFLAVDESVLSCTRSEHTHGTDCVPPEPQEEEEAADSILEFVSDEYVTTITAPGEALLPADTVLTADPIYDSDAPAMTTVALFAMEGEAPREDHSAYVDAIVSKIDWGEVYRIKLFDITLTAAETEVQPSAPVEVKTSFTEPLYVEPGDMIYGVHFGAAGLEILPASTERDGDGNILSVSHVQSSFSVTGYVLIHNSNPKDAGPDIMPVHYCIWVNDQWIIAGSSRTGWYGNYDPRSDWPPNENAGDTRDYITVAQMASVLEPYGLKLGKDESDNIALSDEDIATIAKTIWYQRAEDDGRTVRHDTKPVYRDVTLADGSTSKAWVFELSGNRKRDNGYHVYYVPGGVNVTVDADKDATYADNTALASALPDESRFFSMEIRDRQGVVYEDPETIPAAQYYRYKEVVTVKVKPHYQKDAEGKIVYGTDGKPVNLGWMWVNDKGQVVHGIERLYDENRDGVFNSEEADPRFHYEPAGIDGLETYTFGLTQEQADELNDKGSYDDGKPWEPTGILGRTTLIPYTTAVDGAEQTTDKRVDIVVHLDGEWQKVGQLNLMYRKQANAQTNEGAICQGDWFVTAGQVYSILKDFGFEPSTYTPDDATNVGHKFTHAHGVVAEGADPGTLTMNADGNNDILDGTTAIGLGPDIGDYTLFYLPGSTGEGYDAVHGVVANAYAGTDKIINDRFFSISVVDKYQLVYYGYETTAFKVYVQEGTVKEGDEVSVTIETRENVLWTLRETWAEEENYEKAVYEVDSSDSNKQSFIFEKIKSPIVIEASSFNPTFYVQYYADIERYSLSTTNTSGLPLINTDNGLLPANGTGKDGKPNSNDLMYLTLQGTGTNTTQNAGKQTALHKVATYTDTAEIYDQKEFSYLESHNWYNIDKLWQNDGYTIQDIWILKEGADPYTTDVKDWWRYTAAANGANIEFTNEAALENIPKDPDQTAAYPLVEGQKYVIQITEGMIMRLRYELAESSFANNNVSFYDYDISSNGSSRVRQGINSVHGSKTGSGYAGYAFGNENTDTGTADYTWGGNTLNKSNKNSYKGCTFGLVKGIDPATGAITWSGNIVGPKIFGADIATGKHNYTGTLSFDRKGDVYTLSASSVAGGSRSDLQYFFNPSPKSDVIYDGVNQKPKIFTNNFWALDGQEGVDKKGGGYYGWQNPDHNFLPASDDGTKHNSYFGMSFALDFHISDYIGPMEYIFFGDDDMWVFLDSDNDGDGAYESSKLICDIGGVHSAVGEYVDLRDYLPVKDSSGKFIDYMKGNYRLRFYYTERGASGSTCWMSFTLPSVTSTIVEGRTSFITLEKELKDYSGTDLSAVPEFASENFAFDVKFYTDAAHTTPVNSVFPVKIIRDFGKVDHTVEFKTVNNNTPIYIGAGDKAEISGVPVGTYYVIEEKADDRFSVKVDGQENSIVGGQITESGIVGGQITESGKVYPYLYTNLHGYKLPNTGGRGTLPYICSGWALILFASLLIKTQRKKRREAG